MPTVSEAELDRANGVIATEGATPLGFVPIMDGIDRFERVARRVEPHAEAMCRQETPDRDCDLTIRVDLDPRMPANAFQTVNSDGPLIIVTSSLLQGRGSNRPGKSGLLRIRSRVKDVRPIEPVENLHGS